MGVIILIFSYFPEIENCFQYIVVDHSIFSLQLKLSLSPCVLLPVKFSVQQNLVLWASVNLRALCYYIIKPVTSSVVTSLIGLSTVLYVDCL